VAGQHQQEAYDRKKLSIDRCAYDLDFLISQQPRSIVNPTPARTPAPNELEYLDVFDFFNYPRVPIMHESLINGDSLADPNLLSAMNSEFSGANFTVPNPETDWLFESAT
jgi:hypothetical protein